MIPLRYNIRSVAVRRTTSLMTALGVGLVAMLLLLLLGFINGMQRTVTAASQQGAWMLLQRGVNAEGGFIPREQYDVIKNLPQISLDNSSQPLLSPEIVAGFDPTPDEPIAKFFLIRGVTAEAYKVHRNLRLDSGRWPRSGQAEWVVGRKLAVRYPSLTPPHEFHFGRRMWTIVGVFSDNGSARESEAWTDLDVFAQDAHASGLGYNAIHLVLKPGEAESFKKSLSSDARLQVDALTEDQYYEDQAKFAAQFRNMGFIVAIVLGVGAIFGGMNTMYSAVARRAREVGVLRSLGFERGAILLSFVIESALIGVAGGIAGEVLGLTVARLTGLTGRLMNVGTLIFTFKLSPQALATGLLAALLIGLGGGLLPAWRAARIRIIDSIRAV